MAITTLQELKAERAPDSRLLGLDVGSKTVGLALSDVTLTIATPYRTLRRTTFAKDAEHLRRTIDEHGVGGLVIGLPLQMDGTEGRRCQSVRSSPPTCWRERIFRSPSGTSACRRRRWSAR